MDYTVIKVSSREHVVRSVIRKGHYNYTIADPRYPDDPTKHVYKREIMPQPNYHGTGMALCGVLGENETLREWIKKPKRRDDGTND